MTTNNSLREKCHVRLHDDEDTFVGIRADTNGAKVFFPLGYQKSETDEEIRRDIIQLLRILNEFKDKKEGYISKREFDETLDKKFPINAYIDIILYYMQNGYYKEVEPVYKTRERGKIDWSRTIKQQRPLLSLNSDKSTYSPVYTNFTVKLSTPNEDNEITLINKYCVYESFKAIGWIFTSFMPHKYEIAINTKRSLSILRKKLANTNNDVKKRLFKSMIEIIGEMDENPKNEIYFGTNRFEYVFEGMIEKAFGNKNNKEYYPVVKWRLIDKKEPKFELRPDTIMCHNGDFFVIDSKYYRYGCSKEPEDLPSSGSINKQIIYGEYVQLKEKGKTVYNAFLMPYNKNKNQFDSEEFFSKEFFLNIGEAIPEWKFEFYGESDKEYEHIQGILVDINHLMKNYTTTIKEDNIEKLAEFIRESFNQNKKLK